MTARPTMRTLARTLAALAAGIALACGGAGDSGGITGTSLGGAVATISLSSTTVALEVGGSTTLQAQAFDQAGHALAREIFWSSSDTTVVRVSADGRVAGVAVGRAEVAANAEGKFTKAAVTVGPRAVATVQLTPAAPRLMVGARASLSARTLAADGSELAGRTVTWTTADPRIVTVDSAGTIEGRAPGVATVTATSEERVASVGVTVVAVPIASLVVSPDADTIVVGQTTQLAVTLRDSAGGVLADRAVAWSSSDPAIVSVSSSGLVLAASPGAAQVTATAEGHTATARLVALPRPATAVILSPNAPRLQVGDTVRLATQVTDAAGAVLAGRRVDFASSDSTVARVNAAGLVTGAGEGAATITATSDGARGTATVSVTAAAVATIDLLPPSASVTVGDTLRLRATARDAGGNALADRPITWTSGAPGVASVSTDGKLTAIAAGTAVILASSGRASATLTVTVRAVPAVALLLVPQTISMLVGDARDLAATVVDAAGRALPYPVTFASSDESVAIVSSAGRVVARAVGTAQITASSAGVQGTASVSVIPEPAVAVALGGIPGSMLPGATAQLTATATDRFHNVLTGRRVVWATADPAVATVSTSGVLTAVAAGATTVSATVDGVTGSGAVTVTQTPVARVTLSLGAASLPVGQTTQGTATAFDAANNVLAGRPVTWASSDGGVASVSASGVVTAVAAGSATITATIGGQSASAGVTVTVPTTPPPPPPPPPTVAKVSVSLATSSLTVGGTTAASVTLRDASDNPITGRAVAWSSSNTSVASVSASGAVTAVGAGTATITASVDGVTGSASLTVTAAPPPPPAPVANVAVSLGASSVVAGGSTTATVTLRDAGGNVLTGRAVAWSSSNSDVATVNSAGAVSAGRAGRATITATSEGVSGSATITVTAAPPPPPTPVASVTVTLGASSLIVGGTTTATVTLRDAGGNVLTGRAVTWSSSDGTVASVSGSGGVTAVGVGAASITATSEGVIGSASLTVAAPPPAPVASVTVSLGASSLVVGGTTAATVTLRDAVGNVLTGRAVTWTSANGAVASVSAAGAVSALGAGSTTITATSEGVSGSASLTVTTPPPAPVATVTVSLGSASLTTGQTTAATATLRDAGGNVLSGRPVTWSSSNSAVASVSTTGQVTAVSSGSATITATSGGVNGSAGIAVVAPPPAPVASVGVTLGASTLTVGGTTSATVTLRDAAGNVLTGRTVSWTSSDGTVASVSGTGAITALAAGAATITATSEGVSGTASLTVTAPPPPPPPPAPVASVTVSLGASSLVVGGTTSATVTLRDANGNVLTGRAVTFTSSDGAIASVNGSGAVTAVGAGAATITATSEGISGSASITVTSPAPVVARVTVSPGSLNLRANDSRRDTGGLFAVAFDARGNVIIGATFTWSVDDPSVAAVSGNGAAVLVTALKKGDTTVRVRSGNATDASTVQVK
jgi:uncharacterized protein YjdB